MPHIVVEYAEDLSFACDLGSFMQALHETLAAQEGVDINRIKTRCIPVQHAVVGAPAHPPEMLHITLKLLSGRSPDLRKTMALALQACARDHLSTHPQAHVTVEVVELDPATYCA